MFSLGNKPTAKKKIFSIRVHVKALHYVARNTAVNSRTQELVFCPKATGMKGLGHCRGKPHRSYMPMSRTIQTKQDTFSLLLGPCFHNKTPALIDLRRTSRFSTKRCFWFYQLTPSDFQLTKLVWMTFTQMQRCIVFIKGILLVIGLIVQGAHHWAGWTGKNRKCR